MIYSARRGIRLCSRVQSAQSDSDRFVTVPFPEGFLSPTVLVIQNAPDCRTPGPAGGKLRSFELRAHCIVEKNLRRVGALPFVSRKQGNDDSNTLNDHTEVIPQQLGQGPHLA